MENQGRGLTLDALDLVSAWRRLELAAAVQLAEAVRVARADGYSWAEIGAAIGTTKQAAWQRFFTGIERDAYSPGGEYVER